jgi:Hypoxia induced protein conserved region
LDKKPDRWIGDGLYEGDGGWSCAVLCTAMASFLSTILLPVAVGAVALVLLLGLLNMMRGGSPSRSQHLMRLRVLLQFVAIVITMLAVWAMGR